MNPQQNPEIPEFIEVPERGRTKKIQRRAIAPYNFVELPEKLVEISTESLPQENRYFLKTENRYTGKIECTLTTESPLYIRCGLTKEEFDSGKESKDLPDFFYTNPGEKFVKPVLPGSSIRGMIRNLVEIITFSKIDPVSDNQRLFFRAVAANPKQDSLGEAYKQYILPNNIEAGYLKQDSQGWYIQPAKTEQGKTFAWVKEIDLDLEELIKFDDNNYKPQYIPVSYQGVDIDHNDRAKRLFASNIDKPDINPKKKGVLVTSGNMKQGDSNKPSPRRNHCVVFDCLVFASDSSAQELRLDHKAVDDYRHSLTDFQKQEPPFNKNWGMLNKNCTVVFYYPPAEGNSVTFFGQSPNFRIPYSPQENGYAANVTDFIPPKLKNTSKIDLIDLADAIFGWVKKDNNGKLPENIRQRASRIFVTDAEYESNENGIWYKDNPDDTVTPPILSEPKPTCFQHYLVQPKTHNPKADKSKLKHYASKPELETVIRGHKLYWHKGRHPNIQYLEDNHPSGTQTTKIKPIHPGVKFKFTIDFENLSNIELGALLWVLDISQKQDKQYRLKLGMGKPLGMGAVKIEPKLYLSDRQQRYRHLFNGNHWEKGELEHSSEDLSKYKNEFEKELLKQLHHHEIYQKFQEFEKIPRVQTLLAMLGWEETPNQKYLEQRRYMEIERKNYPRINDANEYKERPVLPTPLQIIGWMDNSENPPPSSKPILKKNKPKT